MRFVALLYLIGLFLYSPCALAHRDTHDGHEKHTTGGKKRPTSPSKKNAAAPKSHDEEHHHDFEGWRFQLAAEGHGSVVDAGEGSEISEFDIDVHVGPNYASKRWEGTIFFGVGHDALTSVKNPYGWKIVFGAEFSAIVAEPLHLTTKFECESGLYRRNIFRSGQIINLDPPIGCALMVGPEIELARWGEKDRSELSLEALLGIGGEYDQEKWGPAEFRFLLGTHINF